MEILCLCVIVVCMSVQNVFSKLYTEKMQEKGVYTFSFLLTCAALIFFTVTAKDISFNKELLLYSMFFAVSYICAMVFVVAAMANGSLSITTLIVSYSLMIPTLYGLFALKDPVGKGFLPGIILLVISLLMMNIKKGESNQSNKISLKWVIYVALAFFGNGMCSVVQKMQQTAFEGNCKNEFMILSLAIAALILGVLSVIREGKDMKVCIKRGAGLAAVSGFANGGVNLLVMVLSGMMPVSVMFPLISASSITLTYLVSRFCMHEKFTKLQNVGFIVGIISVVFLNI